MTAGQIRDVNVTASDLRAYKESVTFTLECRMDHKIVQNGKISVTLPTALSFNDVTDAQNNCKLSVFAGTPTCTVTGNTIVYDGAFTAGAAAAGVITITVTGVRN